MVGFEVVLAVVMKSYILWDITPYSPLKVNGSLGETCRFHLQGQIIIEAKNRCVAGSILKLCFVLVSCLIFTSNLKVEEAYSSET
jgi:hypothetical protein